jgi:hypothetical protein
MADDEKVKAVARCAGCGAIVPVRVWADETIHSISGEAACSCEESAFEVISPEAESTWPDGDTVEGG